MAFVSPITTSALPKYGLHSATTTPIRPVKARFGLADKPARSTPRAVMSPGFDVHNKTAFRLQISLNQVGPLYWQVVKPGHSFSQTTGAVWFTIKAETFLDDSQRLTTAQAILPIAVVTTGALLAVFTGGASAVAAAGAGGAAALGTVTASVSSALVAAGLPATAAVYAGGALVAGVGAVAASSPVQAALKEVFKTENISVSKAGCYAGPPWPFRDNLRPQYEVTGGPMIRKTIMNGKEVAELVGRPLVLRKTN